MSSTLNADAPAPTASVIIPALNAEHVIERQLACLARQTRTDFEVIIADNGGSPELREIASRWSDRLTIRVVDATSRPGCGPARNIGVAAAMSDKLLFCDADDLVAPEWVDANVLGLGQYDFCTGPKLIVTEEDLVRSSPGELFAQRTGRMEPNTMGGSAPFASGCNAAYRRSTLDAIGGFCTHNLRREDVEAGWLALAAGKHLGFVNEARILYVQRNDRRGTFRQAHAWGVGLHALRRQFGPGVVTPFPLAVKRAIGSSLKRPSTVPESLGSVTGQFREWLLPGRYFEHVRRDAQHRTPRPPRST